MPSVHEILTEQFRQWESRGRGWRVYDQPVSPEPPFLPFGGHYLPDTPAIDDGRRPTLLSSFVRKLGQKLGDSPEPPPAIAEPDQEPEPQGLVRNPPVELQVTLPANLNIPKEAFEQFLLSLSLCREPITFELLGSSSQIVAQFATHSQDAPLVRRQLQAYFPDAAFIPKENALETAWNDVDSIETAAVEFGLAREFMYSLATTNLDPFVGLMGALSELEPDELGLFQVIFQPVHQPWSESILRSVTDYDGEPFFVNAPELAKAARGKVSKPLYAAVVRIAALAQDIDRAWAIARDMAAALRVFAHPSGNELIPLTNDDYPYVEHVDDVLRRQSRRTGMLLNSDELIGFVHLPSSTVRSPKLKRQMVRTKAAPRPVLASQGLLLGHNTHAGKTTPIRLSPDQRVRHTHIIGASGTGKSTLLFNLIQQDIDNGEGLAVLDPHGDLIDRILGVIPPERIADVVLVDPSDEEYSVGFNILSAHSDLEKNLLASDLVSVFQRLSTSWGDQMGSVLQNGILAFLESSQGGTLADLRRFLIEPSFRTEFLKTVRDPDVVYYWQKGFPHLSGNKSIGPVLTRLGDFLSPKPIRYMVSQKENRLDFADIMDSGKILLAKLPEGLLGRENSCLLGAVLLSKFQQLVMSRQAKQVSVRRDFWIYVDEFANFITPSIAEILSGARKYRIGLTLAHHELHQLRADSRVESAVMSHPFTRIVFRVGDDDARKLSDGFSSFEARDLTNLETGEAVARVERSDYDFNLSIPLPQELDETLAAERRKEVIQTSRLRYAVPRAQIEEASRHAPDTEQSAPTAPPHPTSRQKSSDEPPTTESRSQSETISVPPSTGSPPPAQPDTASKETTPTPPADLGRGGAQHQAIQQRLKHAAEELGFRATIEKLILDGQGSVDLLLERGETAIACEISVTNTIDYEVGNVRKCLKAGFSHIAVICMEEKRLRKLAAAVSGSLGPDASSRVTYLQPDAFIAHLKTLQPPAPAPPAEPEVRRGYKIRRTHVQLPPEELKAREAAAIRAIAEAMRKKPKGLSP